MCDGWPAGPAPSRLYSTPIRTAPDPYPSLLLLGLSWVASLLSGLSWLGRGALPPPTERRNPATVAPRRGFAVGHSRGYSDVGAIGGLVTLGHLACRCRSLISIA